MSKSVCKHIEATLPQPNQAKYSVGSFPAAERIEVLGSVDFEVTLESCDDQYTKFINSLRPYGLSSLQEQIIVGTFFYNRTQKELAEELRLPNAVSVNRELKHILNLLRKRGFKL